MLNRGERFVAHHSRMIKETTTPEGWHTVTPRIVAQNAEQLVSFLRQVFDATGDYQTDRPSIIMIGDSMIMISEAGIRKPVPAFLYVYVSDCDATYQRALNSGAGSLEDPVDTPYGDRRCMVEDDWGNTWQIATHGGWRNAD
jgi:PhnB protein